MPLRLAIFYIAVFLVLGIQLPYWPVWLEGRGLDERQIGIVLAASMVIRTVSTPIFSSIADDLGERRRPMIVLAILALLAYFLYVPMTGFWLLLGVTLLSTALYFPLISMIEAVTIQTARLRGFDYGRLRTWGSASFVAANILGGVLLSAAGYGILLPAMLVGLALLVWAAFLLPGESEAKKSEGTKRPRFEAAALRAILRSPHYWLFALSAGLIQGAHALYYAFSAIHWASLGISGDLIGVLWGFGVVSEIVLFLFAKRFISRINPLHLIMIGGAGATLRWLIMAADPGLGVLFLIQGLHSLSFGATHLGAIYLIDKAVPPAYALTAQSVYSSMSQGIISGGVMVVSGALYAQLGGLAFCTMSCLAMLGFGGTLLLTRLWRSDLLVEERTQTLEPRKAH